LVIFFWIWYQEIYCILKILFNMKLIITNYQYLKKKLFKKNAFLNLYFEKNSRQWCIVEKNL